MKVDMLRQRVGAGDRGGSKVEQGRHSTYVVWADAQAWELENPPIRARTSFGDMGV